VFDSVDVIFSILFSLPVQCSAKKKPAVAGRLLFSKLYFYFSRLVRNSGHVGPSICFLE
jgi:hypothetical protein